MMKAKMDGLISFDPMDEPFKVRVAGRTIEGTIDKETNRVKVLHNGQWLCWLEFFEILSAGGEADVISDLCAIGEACLNGYPDGMSPKEIAEARHGARNN